jgi:hypothetical protein
MNFIISIIGWLAWNVIVFRIEKDKYDDKGEHFPFSKYFSETWDNWLASLFMIPILLYLGYKGLGINAFGIIDIEHLNWSDAYYLGSGFFTEAAIYAIKKMKTKYAQ